jgi:hypothetical protein
MLLADDIFRQMKRSIDRPDKRLPERESIAKLISKARNMNSVLEQPWNLGILSQKPVAVNGESLPLILKLQVEMKQLQKPITMRQAIWMDRLTPVIKSTRVKDHKLVLYHWAAKYAIAEQIAGLLDNPLDTSELDDIVVTYPEEYVTYPFWFKFLQERKGIPEAGVALRNMIDYQVFLQHLEQKSDKDEKTLKTIDVLKGIIQEVEDIEVKARELDNRVSIDTWSKLESWAAKSRRLKNVLEVLKQEEAQNERPHS